MKKYNPHYDTAYLLKSLSIYLIVVLMMYMTKGPGFVFIVPFVLIALFTNKPEKAFFWLLLTVALVTANPRIVPKDVVFSIAQRMLMVIIAFTMASKIFGGRKSPAITTFFSVVPYLLFAAISSAQGWCPLISYLKMFLFTSVFFAYLGVAKQAGEANLSLSTKMRSCMLAFACFFIFGSTLLIPFPGLSQLLPEQIKNTPNATSLFMGMTMHSQSLGPAIAGINALVFADMMFSIKRFDRLYVALLLCCPILIFKTSSRTGMGTYLAGILYVTFLFFRARGISSRWKSRALNIVTAVLAVAIMSLFATSSGREGVTKYMLKGQDDGEGVSVDQLTSSRQALVDDAMYSFKQKPLIGNGFQVKYDTGLVVRDSIKSFLTAPVEKGVWFTAVLEEGGVPGMILFVFFIFGSIIRLAKYKAYIASSCLLVLIVSNFGEFTVFSMSYTGGILWAIVFAGLTIDVQRLRLEREVGRLYYGPPMMPMHGRW